MGEGEEEQEAADEKRRVVRKRHSPCHEQQVGEGDEERHGAILLDQITHAISIMVARTFRHGGKLFAKAEEVDRAGGGDRESRLVAEVQQHFRGGEAPLLGDH